MTNKDFEVCFESRVDMCRRVLVGKNQDYARNGEKLWNFKQASGMDGCTPEMALKGMLLKHWQSIRDLIGDLERGQHHSMAVWEEKVGDALNYLFILRALVEERYMCRPAIADDEPSIGDVVVFNSTKK